MRINRYLALKKISTRRGADELIRNGSIVINGKLAALGDQVAETDVVEVRATPKAYRYYAYNKPRGIITHSPQGEEVSIAQSVPLAGVFPIGRLDKDSGGLILMTDDGRVTDALLNPKHEHEKEYVVTTLDPLPKDFKKNMERGVDIGGYTTQPCAVALLGTKSFSIVLTEGKNHQIRRMCGAFGQSAVGLQRVRIMNIRLGALKEGSYREIKDAELADFLKSIAL